MHPALQFTSTISEMELPFLDSTLRIYDAECSDLNLYLLKTTSIPLHSILISGCKRVNPYSRFVRLLRHCSNDDDFLVRSREMVSFFTGRGYRLSSLENDLQRVATIIRPNALCPSKQRSGSLIPPV